jgi:hypothetical protein
MDFLRNHQFSVAPLFEYGAGVFSPEGVKRKYVERRISAFSEIINHS